MAEPTLPTWVVRPALLTSENAFETAWEDGYPSSVKRTYNIVLSFPAGVTTVAQRQAWLTANVEAAMFVDVTESFLVGVPKPKERHPIYTGLYVRQHSIRPSQLSSIVEVVVTYARPDSNPSGSDTDNGVVPVPLGSWGKTVSWTTAKLAGLDYNGKPFMTLAGEPVNVSANVPIFTLTRSKRTASNAVAPPTINKEAVIVAGFTIPKHCGLHSQTNVETTGADSAEFPRTVTDQVIYIPRVVNVTDGVIVNGTGGLATLADVGSYDVLILHQGNREKLPRGGIGPVMLVNKYTGQKVTLNALSVLDATGYHVEPDPATGIVTPYYQAFQVYPDSVWAF